MDVCDLREPDSTLTYASRPRCASYTCLKAYIHRARATTGLEKGKCISAPTPRKTKNKDNTSVRRALLRYHSGEEKPWFYQELMRALSPSSWFYLHS